jgi:hypothetical protein
MQEAFFGTWVGQPHFTDELLVPLHDLNRRFLDLVASRGGDWHPVDGLPGARALPGEASRRVAPLTAVQRAAAARCPYALFDLRFHDDRHWRAHLETMSSPWRIADQLDGEAAGFVRLVLFYGWHVAATTGLAARLLLGMTENTAAAFRGLALDRLLALAASESVNLTARWPECDKYWRSLVGAAASADCARLRRVHLFGLQLAAAAQLPQQTG